MSGFKDLELWVVENHLMWVLGTGSGPLKEEQVLLNAEPSLQIHMVFFLYTAIFIEIFIKI